MSGIKHDKGKPSAGLLADFSLALFEVAEIATEGAEEYGLRNWQGLDPDRIRHALWRHLLATGHESNDPKSGRMHLAHVAWNALALLQMELKKENP